MDHLTNKNRREITRLLFNTKPHNIHANWLYSADSEKNISLIERNLPEQNLIPLAKFGQIIAIAVVETKESPLSATFTRKLFTDNFGHWGGLATWLLFRLDKYIQVNMTPETFHIETIVVAEEFRKQGWGNKLLDQIAHRAGEIGKTNLVLEISESHQETLPFFTANGFTVNTAHQEQHPLRRFLAQRARVGKFTTLEKDLLA